MGGDGVGGMAGLALFFGGIAGSAFFSVGWRDLNCWRDAISPIYFGGMAGSAFFFGGTAGLGLVAGCNIFHFCGAL